MYWLTSTWLLATKRVFQRNRFFAFAVIWDGINKKKLTSLPPFATSIAALAFNHDGTELAIASSYTFEEGEREHPRDEIFVRAMSDVECLPKSVKE